MVEKSLAVLLGAVTDNIIAYDEGAILQDQPGTSVDSSYVNDMLDGRRQCELIQ